MIILFHTGALGRSELNAMKIAEFMGHEVRHVERVEELGARNQCVITNAQSIRGISKEIGGWAKKVFVYGFEPTEEHSRLLGDLSSGRLAGVEAVRTGDTRFRVDARSRDLCRQFAGLEFGSAIPGRDQVFVAGRNGSAVIHIGQSPFLVRSEVPGAELLLVANREVADLDAPVSQDVSILRFFSGLAPLMMFAGSVDGAWQNDVPRACFIVDDPLLRERYGFLNYQELLRLMEGMQFCTSIAFIPWNYRRSDPKVARLFADNPERYSLCVHGCDHTGGEFGVSDDGLLRQKAKMALERMAAHREASGLAFDDVMVFPQGVFSTSAMEALKNCGYLAAVNSTPYPVDTDADLTLRDLLEVAVTQFANFPLFTRRYPQRLAELAFDLFVGKPALIVEHHGFFRNGYERLTETIETVQRMDERLEWASLGETCSQACRNRVGENGSIDVQFFTDRFSLRNEADQPQEYTVRRRTPAGDAVRTVTIDGRQTDLGHAEDGLEVQVKLDSGQEAKIHIEHDRFEPAAVPAGRSRMHNAKVCIRRCLSEFRDNYVDTNSFLRRPIRTR